MKNNVPLSYNQAMVVYLYILLMFAVLFIQTFILGNMYVDLAEVSEHINGHVINCQCQ